MEVSRSVHCSTREAQQKLKSALANVSDRNSRGVLKKRLGRTVWEGSDPNIHRLYHGNIVQLVRASSFVL
eukprot:5675298-Pleurochrysis_carterae.AAC.2